MRKNKLLLLLALLLTAATGAWAQDAKHLITATYREQTRSLEQPLPYATTIGELYEAVSGGQSFSDLISSMSSVGMPLTGITSRNTSVVSIGELNGASTPVTVKADGEATISIKFGSYAQGIFVSAISPLYANMKDGVKDADKWTVKVGEGEAQALPIGGLKGDGKETVTLQYNGRLKVKGVKATSEAAPADPLAVPLTIEAITAGTINVLSPKEGMQYSKNGGAKTAVTTSIDVAAGDKVAFYGNGTSITSYSGTIITGRGDGFTCKVYGNIMSLVDEENFATAKKLSENYTFKSLFSGFTKLTDASGLLLPATQLTTYCYYSMFQGCSALTTAPELPATQLANNCYYSMFQYCNNLTAAPELKATQLAESCYRQMFHGCSALTAAPVLPAETLVGNCYRQMFYNCSKLATVTCLATSGIDVSNSTTNWLNSAGSDAQGTKTVYTSSSADWPSGNNGIPEGWVREVATTDAQAAKPAATVTTAPTGAAIVGVGKTTALVSGGVADGGTMMYAVTTTNTKPASTDGFSDKVPTAETITASGKVYVWYYVKGDDTHSDSEIAATAIEVPVADIVWDITNVTDLNVSGTKSYTKEGVTLSCNAEEVYATWINDGISFSAYQSGGFTFTAPTGKAFTKIEMKALDSDGWATANLGTGWAFNNPTVTWKGSAASTVGLLTGADNYYSAPVTYIAFYLSEQAAKEPATVTTAPTGAAIVGVGKTTALVSGGAADGGTLMYAVTTTNTKPASTDGFSGTVPTAETITASGTVYVWYYVKADDDTHSDSEIAATAIEVPVADIVWDVSNVTDIDVQGTYMPYVKEGITLSANDGEDIFAGWADNGDPKTDGISFQVYALGGFTFMAPTGKEFTKIEMNAQGFYGWNEANLGVGWTYFEDETKNIYKVTWTGSAASTDKLLPLTEDFIGDNVKSIGFYLVDAE